MEPKLVPYDRFSSLQMLRSRADVSILPPTSSEPGTKRLSRSWVQILRLRRLAVATRAEWAPEASSQGLTRWSRLGP